MPTIELTQPTAQYTSDGVYALVQFGWRTAAVGDTPAGAWHRESYSPTQAALSARASSTVLAVSPGYWGDDEVRADVLAWMAAQYGFTTCAFGGGS